MKMLQTNPRHMADIERDSRLVEHPEHWKNSLVLLIAHGSENTAGAADLVMTDAEDLTSRGLFGDVRASFLRGTDHPRDVIRSAHHENIYVVPYMISDGYSIEVRISIR